MICLGSCERLYLRGDVVVGSSQPFQCLLSLEYLKLLRFADPDFDAVCITPLSQFPLFES